MKGSYLEVFTIRDRDKMLACVCMRKLHVCAHKSLYVCMCVCVCEREREREREYLEVETKIQILCNQC